MDGKYIYGITTGINETALDISGLFSHPVYTIAHQGLSCVVSDYSGQDFNSVPAKELIRHLLAHQVVVECVMEEHTVLPVKFGTVFASDDEVRDLLSVGYAQFWDGLAWIQDKTEVEVAVTWNAGQPPHETDIVSPATPSGKDVTITSGQQDAGECTHPIQVAKSSKKNRQSNYRERMLEFLRPVVIDAQPNTLISDKIVTNISFLIEKTRLEEFNHRVRQLDDLFRDQICFRTIGPLPPYNFATVEIIKLRPEEVEAAKKLLRLSRVTSASEVSKAYRIAAETHLDHMQDSGPAKRHLARLRQASDLLTAYCRGRAESGNSFLINVSRSLNKKLKHFHFAETGA